ncbi:MAG: TIGR00730 family Rossman fold protein [Clostridia bacterium]|nr:TIGR00730 family Rossman fold protein [Clostridia bacterium]
MRICIFGAASDKIDKKYIDDCYNLAKELALRGHDLVFGAGGEGLMGAAARGFKENGGKVHGVIPYFFEENGYEAIFKGCDELTRTETMAERKRVMEDAADAFIIVPGGIGTLEEFFEVLTLKQLGRHKKAIAIYNSCGYYTHFDTSLDEIISQKFVNKECKMLYKTLNSYKEIIEYIENYTADGLNWDLLKRN